MSLSASAFVFLKRSRQDSGLHRSFLALGSGLRDFPELSRTPKGLLFATSLKSLCKCVSSSVGKEENY